ncbi:hypothetical protein LTR37_017076 [Vermiconidia calcicola]|uniref:Uncharacterized protein n=1 Tax=Vermiconidia calcicola TaxID=1690605 RepID=A0ACC3ML17_9PEZI|nr:hypothetical protein LTR37_017076 [Vermiconidia calcicola]
MEKKTTARAAHRQSLREKARLAASFYHAVPLRVVSALAAGLIYYFAAQHFAIVPFEDLLTPFDYTAKNLGLTLSTMLFIYFAVSWSLQWLLIDWAFVPSNAFYRWMYGREAKLVMGEEDEQLDGKHA